MCSLEVTPRCEMLTGYDLQQRNAPPSHLHAGAVWRSAALQQLRERDRMFFMFSFDHFSLT